MKRYLKILAAGIFLALPWIGAATAQQVNNYCLVDNGPPLHWAPCSVSNPLAVNASVSASITGFPGTTQTTGTPISVTTGGVTGTLPAGTEVVASNVGATNNAYCKLGASATTSDQMIPPNSWFGFTVGSNTQLTCITSTSTTTVNMVGGAGLPTGAGGGGSGGGGSNAAAGATGSAVPASASYNGLNIGGNLRGQTGANPTGSVFAAQTDLTSVGGTSYALGQQVAAASMPVVLTAAQITTLTPLTTVTVTQATGTNLHAVLDTTSTTAVTQATSSNLKAQVDPLTIATWGLAATTQNVAAPTNGQVVMGQFTTTPTTLTTTNVSPLQLDNLGNLLVNIKAGASSGAVAQGSTTSGQTGLLVQGAVTTAAPSYTTAQTSPLSLTTAGELRTLDSQVLAAVQAPVPAGEFHIGEIASNQIKVQVAQTVTASAYSAGNALGSLMTVANAARVSGSVGAAGTGGILTGLQLNSKTIQTGVQVDIFIFDANPTGSTCTDKTAFVIAAADFDKVVGILSIPSTPANGAGWFGATTTGAVGIPTYFPVTYDLASSTSIYACAVVRAAITPAATTDISFKYNILRN